MPSLPLENNREDNREYITTITSKSLLVEFCVMTVPARYPFLMLCKKNASSAFWTGFVFSGKRLSRDAIRFPFFACSLLCHLSSTRRYGSFFLFLFKKRFCFWPFVSAGQNAYVFMSEFGINMVNSY